MLDGPGHNVAIVGLLRSRVLWNDSHPSLFQCGPHLIFLLSICSNMTGGTSTVICDCNGPHTRGRSLIWMYVLCAAISQRTYLTWSPNIGVRIDSVSFSNGELSIIIPSARRVQQIRSRICSDHVLFGLGWNRATSYGALLFV